MEPQACAFYRFSAPRLSPLLRQRKPPLPALLRGSAPSNASNSPATSSLAAPSPPWHGSTTSAASSSAASANWPKDWAKLLMNATLLAADSLPRGGSVIVETSGDPSAPGFKIQASGQGARLLEEVEKAVRGEPNGPLDGRTIQAYLTHKLARGLNAGLTVSAGESSVEISAG